MGATFSRVKTWTAEVLTYADLNAEFDNILNNLTPAGIDDYSGSVANMQSTADPYPAASPSQATSLQGELQRIRYVLAQLSGETYWYVDPDNDIATINTKLNNAVSTTVADVYNFGKDRATSFYTATTESAMTANAYYDGTNNKYIAASTASKLSFDRDDTCPTYWTAGSGSADATITFTGHRLVRGSSATVGLEIKYLQIGAWDMDANATLTLAHGVTLTDIVSVNSIIFADSQTDAYSINYGGYVYANSTNVEVTRTASGPFDSAAFNDTGVNRGFVSIIYKV